MTSDPLDYFEDLVNYLQKDNVQYRISGEKLSVKFEIEVANSTAASAEESKTEEAPRKVKVVISILKVNENKNCVKFAYTDPTTKADLNKMHTIVQHFIKIRDAEPLRIFCDTTFEEN